MYLHYNITLIPKKIMPPAAVGDIAITYYFRALSRRSGRFMRPRLSSSSRFFITHIVVYIILLLLFLSGPFENVIPTKTTD